METDMKGLLTLRIICPCCRLKEDEGQHKRAVGFPVPHDSTRSSNGGRQKNKKRNKNKCMTEESKGQSLSSLLLFSYNNLIGRGVEDHLRGLLKIQ